MHGAGLLTSASPLQAIEYKEILGVEEKLSSAVYPQVSPLGSNG